MTLFEKNLEALERSDATLAARMRNLTLMDNSRIIPARSGEPTAEWNNKLLHSRYEPSREAGRFIDQYDLSKATAVVMAGFGLGYHVREALKRVAVPLVVVEAVPEILRLAMEYVDLTDVLGRVRILAAAPIAELHRQPDLQASLNDSPVIIPHTASLHCAPEYYADLARELDRRRPLQRPGQVRVMVASPLHGGSLPIARYAAQALRKVGCSVELLDFSPFHGAFQTSQALLRESMHNGPLTNQFTQWLSAMAYARAQEFKPDLVLALAQAPLTKECLRKFRSERIRTALWFVENYKCFNYWRDLAAEYDYFLTIQNSAFHEELRRHGVFRAYYLPTACDPDFHQPALLSAEDSQRYGADISFAGLAYYNRKALFEGLTDFNLKLWGPGWSAASGLDSCAQNQGREFDEAEMLKIFSASKINLNLHSSTYYAGVEPNGDFVNPRLFELAACGAFQLVDDRPPLREFFEPGEEVACFEDLSSLRQQIRFYLNHPEERARLAINAQRRARSEHTYEARMKQMLSWIFSESVLAELSQGRNRETAAYLSERASPDHALYPLLSQCVPQRRITIDDLLSDSMRSARHQTEPELVLRLMKNLLVEGHKR
ncbi:MAG: glycosyltransferase [Acidobacteria bacterium]|nr:glycosyltransferase [Acidobacteriota bacterium]MBI3657196.1 glycosyltransferase [Acidobacteriota bacterium]